jgi:hypothetical protein
MKQRESCTCRNCRIVDEHLSVYRRHNARAQRVAFRLECEQVGILPPTAKDWPMSTTRTDTMVLKGLGTLVGWVSLTDRNYSRKSDRIWARAEELAQQEGRVLRNRRRRKNARRGVASRITTRRTAVSR